MLKQRGSETRVHNVVTIRELRHSTVNKQSKLLPNVDGNPPRDAVEFTGHFNVLHREMQVARNVGFM